MTGSVPDFYPAAIDLRRDRELSPATKSAYGYLQTVLDFTQPRQISCQAHAEFAGLYRDTLRAGVHTLVERKYLVEHDRDDRGAFVLTLAWSRNAESDADVLEIPARPDDADHD